MGSAIADIVARGWENFLARPEGPLNLRFVLQPTIATVMALRAGLEDAREGRPAYLWAAFTNPESRSQLLHGGWKDMRTTFLIAAALDAAYQVIVHQGVYLLELLFTATLLALVPYLVLRGPVNRVARHFIGANSERGAERGTGRRSSTTTQNRTGERSKGHVKDARTGKLDDTHRDGDPEGRIFH